jgi:hypothetical protein
VTGVDVSEFTAAQQRQPNKRPVCNVTLIKRELTPDQCDRLQAALADNRISAGVICEVVNGWGEFSIVLRASVVNKHRRGMRGADGCACDRA